jgi:hypothetical protein
MRALVIDEPWSKGMRWLDHRDREETGMNDTETREICFVRDMRAVAPVSRWSMMDGWLLM